MKSWSFLFTVVFLVGCSSQPTRFQKKKHGEGYFDGASDGLRLSTFVGNQYTKPGKARLYAEFHAIETCKSEGYKFANVIDIFDKSVRKQVTKTDSTGPTYYGSYGMYPFYSRYSGMGVGVGFGTTSSRSWNETYVFPRIEVPYTCDNSIYRPKLMFREVPAEEMKHLVKDIKGGVQVQKIMDDSPNKGTLKQDDMILKAQGSRIERVYELIKLFSEKHTGVEIELLREGARIKTTMKATDVTDVAGAAEEKIIEEACKDDHVKKAVDQNICKK